MRLLSLIKMKDLPRNVRKVKKVTDNVKINIKIINMCLFKTLNIN